MPPDEEADVPDDIKDAAMTARLLARREKRTRDEEEAMNQARIKVAFWACRRDGVYASWENLRFVLGDHAAAIEPAHDRMLADRAEEGQRLRKARRRTEETGSFWGGIRDVEQPKPPPSPRKKPRA